jgi:hypothetical protein
MTPSLDNATSDYGKTKNMKIWTNSSKTGLKKIYVLSGIGTLTQGTYTETLEH